MSDQAVPVTVDLPDRDALADLCLAMTRIPSPTGAERPLAEWLAERLAGQGFDVDLQVLSGSRANVVARRPGSGDGPALLLYSPIDTAFPLPGDAAAGDLGPAPGPAFSTDAVRAGDWIVGAGAENPKGYAACVVATLEAVATADVPLRGDLVVGLAAGGQPTLGSSGPIESGGLGIGCRELLARMPAPDAAVIAKPGDAVSWAEVGIALFRVRVAGDLGYTGIRHRGRSRHAVREGARLMERLEAWFPEYTEATRTELVAPQGAVTAIRAGWPERPAFMAATCDLSVDLRVAPGDTLERVEATFREAVAAASQDLECDVTVEWLGGFPGGSTDPASLIVQASIRAWEARTGRQHEPAVDTSGVTDASILRAHGIPTARIGMPRPASPYPGFSMGAVNIDAMLDLTRTLIDVAVDTCSRPRAEVGPSTASSRGRS